MGTSDTTDTVLPRENAPAPVKRLNPEAERALAEAQARRVAATPLDLPPEDRGRGGPEPVRYGDWEVKGIATDF